MTLNCFEQNKNGISKNCKFARYDLIKIYQDLLLKNGSKFMINQKKNTMLTKKLELKRQC